MIYLVGFLLILAGYILGFQRAKYIFTNMPIFRHKVEAKWTVYYNNIGQFIAKKVIDGKEDTYLSSNNTLVTKEEALIFVDKNIMNKAIDDYEREQLKDQLEQI